MKKNFLIICPLDLEIKFLVEEFKSFGLKIEKSNEYKVPIYGIPEKGIQIAKGGHGKVQFGIHTQYLLSKLTGLNGVICTGAGGALSLDLSVGDLVIGEKTIEHDYEQKFDINTKLPELNGHQDLLNLFREKTLKPNFNIWFGRIASGDEDIIDPIRAHELYSKTDSLAVAWEGIGGAKACKFNEMPFLEIRAITDNAREHVAEAFKKNLKICMKNIAWLLDQVTD